MWNLLCDVLMKRLAYDHVMKLVLWVVKTFGILSQAQIRSTCLSVQSNQSLFCPHIESLDVILSSIGCKGLN